MCVQISKLASKTQEMEFVLMQSYNERDKQAKIIEEITNKFILVENEKNEMENLVKNFFNYYLN